MIMRWVIIFCILLLSWAEVAVYAGEPDLREQLYPYLNVRQEYSDNVFLRPNNEISDYITTIQPGIKYSNMDRTSGIDLDYLLGLVSYWNNSDLNYISHSGNLNAKYPVLRHMEFTFRDSLIRSDEPRERQYFTEVAENEYVLSIDAQRATYWRNVAEPAINYQFGPENHVGLVYRNNMYRTDSLASQDSQENYLKPYFTYWFDKRNGVNFEYGFTHGDFQKNPDLLGHKVSGGYTNRISKRLSAFIQYTFVRRTFDFPGIDYDINRPDVGVTYAWSPTLETSVRAGYYWMDSKAGSKENGFAYEGKLKKLDRRTTYLLSLQGGYTEDFFTFDNFGFVKYSRITGSLNHMLQRRTSIGCLGSIEWADIGPDRSDRIWRISASTSHRPLKWLALALEVSHREDNSNIASSDYRENRGMFMITATY